MPRRIVSMDVDPSTTADEGVDYLARCSQFAELTSTNNALAMAYLQDRGWDLERAVEDYFEDKGNDRNNSVIFIDLTASVDEPESSNLVAPASKPCTLNVLSWNIDGLDQSNFTARLQTIVSYLCKDLPHVVCFQEVVSTSLEFFRSELAESYDIFSATDDPFADCIHYFVAILVRKHPALVVDRRSF
ncbi:tyrosyl-DNA phosphodiesterase 2, partial [Paragonimus westermani]